MRRTNEIRAFKKPTKNEYKVRSEVLGLQRQKGLLLFGASRVLEGLQDTSEWENAALERMQRAKEMVTKTGCVCSKTLS